MPDLTVLSPPRISPALFAEVLRRAASPAAAENTGDALYAIPVQAGLDPAVALGFFFHESQYGTRGLATSTRNWGNLRRSPTGRGTVKNIPGRGNFAFYQTWADSLRDWCVLILGPVYIGAGRTTVDQIIPVYAPSSDNNKPAVYIRAVETAVGAWEQISRGGGWPGMPQPPDPWAAWGSVYPLDPAQRGYAIPAAWLKRAAQLGAAISNEASIGTSPRRVAVRAFVGGYLLWNEALDRVIEGGWANV